MELQKIFTPEYANALSNSIDPDNYFKDAFPFDGSQIRRVSGIEHPEKLEEAMLATGEDEFEAGKLLYESYKHVSPILASSPSFWLYLTHVDLFNYVKSLWPDIKKYNTGKKAGRERSPEDKIKYIREHWHISGNGPMRTTLMNLWWSFYLTADETLGEEHKYDLTKVFFSNKGLRTRRLGSGHLGRNREALKGILGFIKDNPTIFGEGIENRMIWITRHFNLIGGTKPLSNLKAKFFYDELNKYKEHLTSISCREDVVGPDAFV